jgi:diadenosine tetraphosphatase ApaH/serine/threonine PP2A family protein phosphatase
VAIRGNHEEYLLEFRNRSVPSEWLHLEEWAASRWMASELSEEDVDYLNSLELSARARSNPQVLVTHGSPLGTSDGLGPWTRERRLDELVDGIEETVLVCGHTHRPMIRELTRGLVVNVGSVGLPFNGDRRAQYAILAFSGDECRVDLRQVEYDIESTLAAYRETGFLEAGGVTARLLALELQHAAPYLVPFQRWARAIGVPPDLGRLEEFLEFYQPGHSLRDFFVRLERLSRTRVWK